MKLKTTVKRAWERIWIVKMIKKILKGGKQNMKCKTCNSGRKLIPMDELQTWRKSRHLEGIQNPIIVVRWCPECNEPYQEYADEFGNIRLKHIKKM